jgi:DNA-binding NarL/FixJ family response regulator
VVAALSPRERQILALIDEGLANKEIAHRLGIELATVKNHVHHILEKLQVTRRGQAAARARPGLAT